MAERTLDAAKALVQDDTVAQGRATTPGKAAAVPESHAEQTALVYTQAPIALVTALVVAALLAAGLRGVVDHGMLMLWLGLQVMQTLFRAVIVNRYNRCDAAGRRDRRWARLYIVGTLVSGAVWGCIGLFMGPDMPAFQQVLVIMGLAAVLAGAISSYAVLMPVYIAFLAPAMLITAQSMLLQAGQSQNVIGLLFVVFAAALPVIARNYSNSVARTLALRNENRQLLGRMSASNMSLEAEVREREQAENQLKRDRQLFNRGPVTVFRWSA